MPTLSSFFNTTPTALQPRDVTTVNLVERAKVTMWGRARRWSIRDREVQKVRNTHILILSRNSFVTRRLKSGRLGVKGQRRRRRFGVRIRRWRREFMEREREKKKTSSSFSLTAELTSSPSNTGKVQKLKDHCERKEWKAMELAGCCCLVWEKSFWESKFIYGSRSLCRKKGNSLAPCEGKNEIFGYRLMDILRVEKGSSFIRKKQEIAERNGPITLQMKLIMQCFSTYLINFEVLHAF